MSEEKVTSEEKAMREVRRQLYRAIIQLHPPSFRHRFGREMQLDFDDALPHSGFAHLAFDGLLSLGRQWIAVSPLTPKQEPLVHPSLLAGQYAMISLGGPSILDLVRAAMLAITMCLVIGLVATNYQGSALSDPSSEAGTYVHSTPGEQAVSGEQQTVHTHHTAQTMVSAADSSDEASAQQHDARITPTQAEFRSHAASPKSSNTSGLANIETHLWTAIVFVEVICLLAGLWLTHPRLAKRLILAMLGGLTMVAPAAMHPQVLQASGPLPSFEVVSIRPWQPPPQAPPPPPPADGTAPAPKSHERVVPLPGGQNTDRVRMVIPPKLLIAFAYGLPLGFEENRVLNAPDWANKDQYTIDARIDDASFAAIKTMPPAKQREQVALMEQSLLADRFKLKCHIETREMSISELVIAKGGSRLTQSKDGEVPRLSLVNVGEAFQMTATAIPLDAWIHSPFLSRYLAVDKTGLRGTYDFQLTWHPTQAAPSDSGNAPGSEQPPLLTAIQEQLGLKLVPTKGPVEVIVIDHIERPSEN